MNHPYPPVTDRLEALAQSQGEALAYRYLESFENTHPITFGELFESAQQIAAGLSGYGVEGKPVPLIFQAGLPFLQSFFGCLYARAIPVPLPSPVSAFGRDTNRERLLGAVAVCRPPVVLADSESFAALASDDLPPLLNFSVLQAEASGKLRLPTRAGDPAFIQFSSGSTRQPHGIVIRHDNLAANQELIQESFCHEPGDVVGGWLPHYHDMGLIGIMLTPLYQGLPCVFSSPDFFARKPLRWLQMISHYRISSTGAPNFAYELCTKSTKPIDLIDIDLSSWKVAFNGSDMIRRQTVEDFNAKFALYGFSPAAFLNCYGMAETTLIISGSKRGSGTSSVEVKRGSLQVGERFDRGTESGSRSVVACGGVLGEQRVRIQNEVGTELPEGFVGEICVEGRSVARDVWTREGIAPLPRDSAGLFHTGDLGFIQGGDIYVLGRQNNRFKVRGRNIYSEDIEDLVTQSEAVSAHRGMAAFALNDGVVLAIELGSARPGAEEYAAVWETITRKVNEGLGITLDRILFLPKGSFSKTSSGKIRRQALIQEVQSGEITPLFIASLDSVPRAEPAAGAGSVGKRLPWLRGFLVEKIAEILKTRPAMVDTGAKFTELGLDSMSLTLVMGELEGRLNRPLSPTLAWDHPTIDAICRYLEGEPV